VKAKASERLRFLLETVERETRHLQDTHQRLFDRTLDADWVIALENDPILSERLDAFVARFGRLQDTLGDKLVPELLRNLLETPASALDNLNRMEKLGLLPSVDDWMEARNLRNRLIHEYQYEPNEFAAALNRAGELVGLLSETSERIKLYVGSHFTL
jgi:hypothetical protein